MLQKYKILLLFILMPLVYSCNTGDSQQESEREEAYREYSEFVTSFEQDSLTESDLRNMEMEEIDTTLWEKERADLQQQYNTRRDRVTQNQDQFTQEQQEEIQKIDERYNQALAKRDQQYKEVNRRYRLRKDLLGLEVNTRDLSNITAANISETYNRFVNTLAERADNFESRDWDMVEGWWSALNNRYQQIENEVQPAERRKIAQLQENYIKLRKEHQIST